MLAKMQAFQKLLVEEIGALPHRNLKINKMGKNLQVD